MNFQFRQLYWKNFEIHLYKTVQKLLDDDAFTDVTLVSEDHKQFKVHRVILSACSSVFKSLLTIPVLQPGQQIILFMNGLLSLELEALIEFIYLGKTNVLQENMRKFLTIAKDLKILGLQEKTTDMKIVNELNMEQHFSGNYLYDCEQPGALEQQVQFAICA